MQIYGDSVQTEYRKREVKKMRLIDVNKCEKTLSAFADKFSKNNVQTAITLYAVLDIIKGIETVDAVAVKHGKWLLDGCCEIQCSCCDETYSDEIFMMYGGINYCPNCGAKMDGGTENA